VEEESTFGDRRLAFPRTNSQLRSGLARLPAAAREIITQAVSQLAVRCSMLAGPTFSPAAQRLMRGLGEIAYRIRQELTNLASLGYSLDFADLVRGQNRPLLKSH